MAPTVLTIAGSDPTSGAGLQADLKTISDLGCEGRSAVTAITAQTEDRVLGVWPTPADVLTQQVATAAAKADLRAIKVGLVFSAANVWALIWFLRGRTNIPVIVDPLLHSSSGFPLLDAKAVPIFKQHLLPLATVVTPNLAEAMALAGMQVASLEGMEKAAQTIHDEIFRLRGGGQKPLAVVVKGGHLPGTPIDIVFDGSALHRIDGVRAEGSIHGSGCRYASAIAAGMAKGLPLLDAVQTAKAYVETLIRERQKRT